MRIIACVRLPCQLASGPIWRATALVAILLAGILVVALAYRWAAARFGPRGGSGQGAA